MMRTRRRKGKNRDIANSVGVLAFKGWGEGVLLFYLSGREREREPMRDVVIVHSTQWLVENEIQLQPLHCQLH